MMLVNVMLFQWGVVGQYLLAAITSVHLLLFSIIAFEFRTKAPGAKTFLQVNSFRLLLRPPSIRSGVLLSGPDLRGGKLGSCPGPPQVRGLHEKVKKLLPKET